MTQWTEEQRLFVESILPYKPMLMRIVKSILSPSRIGISAEDVVQDVFVKAGNKMKSFRGSELTAWLRRIAVNRALEVLRKHWELSTEDELSHDYYSEDYVEGSDSNNLGSSPPRQFDAVLLREFREYLKEFFPKKERELILLMAQGFTYGEIAVRLDSNKSTLRVVMNRCRVLIKAFIIDGGKSISTRQKLKAKGRVRRAMKARAGG